MRLTRIMLICLLFGCAKEVKAGGPDLKTVREKMLLALKNSKTADSLYTSLDQLSSKPPVIVGYIGCLEALKAKHAWNPYSKVKYLLVSEDVLQQAVTADPHNIEIRFVRFSIEYHLPAFLGMAKNMTADREEMIRDLDNKNYGTADKQLTINLIKFLIDSKKCSAQQTDILHKQLAAL